ncbi:MAG: hypothetical protein H6557_11590 [Lewinellaceae bacterium]|nr:hypothetical protein [Lewinellaceae bacterium]
MPYVIDNIQPLLKKFAFPTVMMWNRVEGRPRVKKNFDRALKAEVRDALWMLTKQWQMGEFEGDDAGSPVMAKVRLDTTQLTKYQAADNAAQAFPEDIPLEGMVEQKVLPFSVFQQEISLDLRLMASKRWKKLLKNEGLFNQLWDLCLDNFPIKLPDPEDKKNAAICAHPDTWQQFAAVAGRAVDGLELFLYLKNGKLLSDLPGGELLIEEPEVVTKPFVEWFDGLFLQPHDPNDNAWKPSQLEYQFQCSAPEKDGEKVLTAREYYHGHLDWYNFNFDPQITTLGEVDTKPADEVMGKTVNTMLPTPVMFDGMPNTRWWAFEEGQTNFSFVKPGTQELSKLLFLEFGLVYANDWYLIPYELPVGTIAKVKGISVCNVFGENFWIEASGRGGDEDWNRWNLYSINIEGKKNVPADTSLLLLPSVPKIQESKPVEKVALIRDEIANMVWGIENIIPLPHGESVSGQGAAAQYHSFLQQLIDKANLLDIDLPEEEEAKAKIRYEIMNQVPENWIPFIPVHIEDYIPEIQLQRAAMPRILEGNQDPPEKVRPRTTLLKEGLKDKHAYYIHEKEVPREGAQVYQSYQRTRWKNGRVFVWFGARKTSGKGEGSSGLAFDRILANKK